MKTLLIWSGLQRKKINYFFQVFLLKLSFQGGPNWAGNFVDAPIIVNPEDGEFYKQPMYYALGHISRFIPPGSVRVGLDVGSNPVQAVAFRRPDNTYAVVLLNR